MAMKFEKKSGGGYLLDICGYVCPHPQIYTKQALGKIKEGDHLEVVFDNPSSSESISQMCEQRGDEIIEKKREGGKFTFIIEKG
ncbi:MAG TPA: sulfurtransferase TusA family protein [Nitrospirae bacterium]|mgnify:CR=1 FL=1|jgi:tRNA 2-thiouridine synthesizing protein A|nr:sulfurtransferase TusA family protein [Nitrospirota bacterium]